MKKSFRMSVLAISFLYSWANINATTGNTSMPHITSGETQIISVTDWHFSDALVGDSTKGEMTITNAGYDTLSITEIISPIKSPPFFITVLDISKDKPLLIAPQKSFVIGIIFKPLAVGDYADTIIVNSNSAQKISTDSMCVLSGKALMPGLIANSYNWGRKRVSTPSFPIAPFPANKTSIQDICINMKNTGSNGVIVDSTSEYIENINGNAFIFDKGSFLNKNILSHDSIIVLVSFLPKKPGPFLLGFSYLNSAGSKTETWLEGIGITPLVVTIDLDFDSTLYQDYAHPVRQIYSLINRGIADWLYGDTIRITGFKLAGVFNGKFTDTIFGNESFKVDFSEIKYPVVLAPGESFEFPVEYVSNSTGDNSGSITTISDGMVETTCFFSGKTITPVGVVDTYNNSIQMLDIFPNPNDGCINLVLTSPKAGNGRIELYDIIGNKLLNFEKNVYTGANTFEINVPDYFANGLYRIVYNLAGATGSRIIILER